VLLHLLPEPKLNLNFSTLNAGAPPGNGGARPREARPVDDVRATRRDALVEGFVGGKKGGETTPRTTQCQIFKSNGLQNPAFERQRPAQLRLFSHTSLHLAIRFHFQLLQQSTNPHKISLFRETTHKWTIYRDLPKCDPIPLSNVTGTEIDGFGSRPSFRTLLATPSPVPGEKTKMDRRHSPTPTVYRELGAQFVALSILPRQNFLSSSNNNIGIRYNSSINVEIPNYRVTFRNPNLSSCARAEQSHPQPL